MKLGLSKKGDPRGRHLMLLTKREEGFFARGVIESKVLEDKFAPVFDFDADRHQWVFRFHMRYLDRIMLTFPFVELSQGLDKWMVTQERKEFAKLPVPDIEVPGFYDYLAEQPAAPFDFQKIGIDEIEKEMDRLLEEANRIAEEMTQIPSYFLNDEMGLGKTIQALAVAVRNRWFPMLFVAPNSGKWSTQRIIDRFFNDDFTYQVVDGPRERRALQVLAEADVTIVNWETIRTKREYDRSARTWNYQFDNPELFFQCSQPLNSTVDYVAEDRPRREYKFLVIDEHHRAKNPDAQITTGMFELRGERVLMMSGTPILNRIEEIWTALHKIDPDAWPTYYQFEKWLCIKKGGKTVGYDPDAVAYLKEYLHKRSIRRRRDHVSDQLPEVVYVRRDVVLTPEQKRLYNRIVDELNVEMEDGSTHKVFNALTRMTRLKQACFSPELYGGSRNSTKIAEMKTDVEQLVDSGEKAIIFSQWSKAARILQREFAGYNPAYVDGSVKGKKRSVQEDKFNLDDDCKLYIGTIGANKEAITLSAATYVLFADKDWTPLANQQAAARSAAGGLRGLGLPPGTKVHIIEYYAMNTVEEWIEEILAGKQSAFNSFIERDGGVRFPKITTKDIHKLLQKTA